MQPNYLNPPAVVQRAEESEQDLIDLCKNALERTNWTIGEAASIWTQRFARGRTDADFAALVGLSAEQIRQRRATFDRFGKSNLNWKLSWTHFNVAVNWDDAEECLDWAQENDATVAEMKAWRRAKNGEDLTEPAAEDNADTQEGQTSGGFGEPGTTRDRPVPVNKLDESKSGRTRRERPRRSPAPAKPEPLDSEAVGGNASEESGKSDDAPPPGLTTAQIISELRRLRREFQNCGEPGEDAEDIADELRSWLKTLTPPDKQKPKSPRQFTPPTLEEVREYFQERGKGLDPELFYDFYTANGWVQGSRGKPVVDWKACVRTWERTDLRRNAAGTGPPRSSSSVIRDRNKAAFDEVFGPDEDEADEVF